eukprot:UN13327
MPNAHFLHGYGMTETAGPCVYHHTSPTGDLYRSGKGVSPITKSFPGMEMKICANNEIILRGPAVTKGYLGNKKGTEEVLRDGWLHTGT